MKLKCYLTLISCLAFLAGLALDSLPASSATPCAGKLIGGYCLAPGANLTNANLSSFDLSNVNLTQANLSGADLTKTKLNGAILTKANLTGVNLSNARASFVNFVNANLTQVSWKRTDFTGSNFTNGDWDQLWPLGLNKCKFSKRKIRLNIVRGDCRSGKKFASTLERIERLPSWTNCPTSKCRPHRS